MTKQEFDWLAMACFAVITLAKFAIGILLLAGGKVPRKERKK